MIQLHQNHMFETRILTVSIAFPVLSSFSDGPFMSASRKKCFPLIPSMVAISLISCTYNTTENLFLLLKLIYIDNSKKYD